MSLFPASMRGPRELLQLTCVAVDIHCRCAHGPTCQGNDESLRVRSAGLPHGRGGAQRVGGGGGAAWARATGRRQAAHRAAVLQLAPRADAPRAAAVRLGALARKPRDVRARTAAVGRHRRRPSSVARRTWSSLVGPRRMSSVIGVRRSPHIPHADTVVDRCQTLQGGGAKWWWRYEGCCQESRGGRRRKSWPRLAPLLAAASVALSRQIHRSDNQSRLCRIELYSVISRRWSVAGGRSPVIAARRRWSLVVAGGRRSSSVPRRLSSVMESVGRPYGGSM